MISTSENRKGGCKIKVIKRDGRAVEYDRTKIEIAISKANSEVQEKEQLSKKQIDNIIKYIESLNKKRMLVEDIQDIIEAKIMEYKKYDLAKAYIIYRYTRALVRKSNTTDETILSIIKNSNKDINYEKYKKNIPVASIQRDLIAKEVSRDLTNRILLPEEISLAHQKGILYFHDADFFIQPIINSSIINLKDMLENGTVINEKLIEEPKSFSVAASILTRIITAIASSQYGGETLDITCLGKYLRKSYEKLNKNLIEKYKGKIKKEYLEEIIEDSLNKELAAGIQTINYQINTLMTITGKEPNVSFYLKIDENDEYLKENVKIIEEIFNQRIKGIKNSSGIYEDFEYPKLIYELSTNNVDVKSKYRYLTDLAIECLKLRNTPSFVSKKANEEIFNSCIPPMSPNHFIIQKKEKGNFGRFNQGLVTINLSTIAIESNKDQTTFINILNEHLDLCKEALLCKHYALLGTTADVSPLHFMYGGISRLSQKEKIDKFLKNGYSTISLSYAGLSETVKHMINKNIYDEEGKQYAIDLIKKLEDTVNTWTNETGVSFVLCALENEETCKYFLEKDKEKYGIIKNVTDKETYTSSYFLDKNTNLSIEDKLKYEIDFIKLSKGGTISKIDISLIKEDKEKLNKLIKFLYDNIVYSELL